MRQVDITGERYGRLVVLSMIRSGGNTKVRCLCDCGSETVALAYNVKNGNTSSCGCVATESRIRNGRIKAPIMGAGNIKHGHTLGYKSSKTYASWSDAKKRCYSPQNKRYAHYGGRGIRMCDAWRESFAAFLADMGERPAGTSLDRIDVHGHYEPGNCRWATQTVQAQNQRTNVTTWEIARAIRQQHATGVTPRELAQKYGMSRSNVYMIVNHESWKEPV